MKEVVVKLFCLILICSPINLKAEEEETSDWSVSTSATVLTDYLFRGFNLYDGVSIQPVVAANYTPWEDGSFGASTFAHLSAENDRKDESFTEIDYTLSYAHNFDPVTLAVGHVWYTYSNDNTEAMVDSNEYFVSVALAAPLNPVLSFYNDYDSFDMQWYELGFSQRIEAPETMGEGFNATPFVSIGASSNSEKVYEDNGLDVVNVGVSFDAALGVMTMTPSMGYTFGVDDATVNEFWSGVKLAYAF